MRHLQRGVADLARLLLEDRADQLLLGGQLGLALGRHLSDQQVAGGDLGADAHDAALVEVAQRLLRAVRDVAGDLLVAQLGRAGVDLVLLDVDRRQHVVLHEPLRDHDRVLEVVALPGHERDASRSCRARARRPTVEEPSASTSPSFTLSPTRTSGRWSISVPWLERMNLCSSCSVLPTTISLGVHVGDLAGLLGDDHVTGVDRGAALHAGADQRRVGPQQRHGLALHVRAHQRAVGVVVLEERDQRRRRPTRSGSARRPSGPPGAVSAVTTSPSRERHMTCGPFSLLVFGSSSAFACAITCSSSCVASSHTILFVTTPSSTTR